MRFLAGGILIAFFVFRFSSEALAQGELPVEMFTGRPAIGVPIWNLTDRDITESTAIVYNAGGIRVDDTGGAIGVGWSLHAGGSIEREVRGLPDDFKGTSPDPRSGWLYTGATAMATVVNLSTTATTCPNTDQANDYNSINAFGYAKDTEPDIFHFNCGGASGSFVFDESQNVRLIPYQDILITPTFAGGTDKTLVSFLITTDNGVKYNFTNQTVVDQWTEAFAADVPPEYLKRDYELYNKKTAWGSALVHYTSSWNLTTIVSPIGGQITFNYLALPSETTTDTVKVSMRKNSVSQFVERSMYYKKNTVTNLELLSAVGLAGQSVSFNYDNYALTSISVLDNRRSTLAKSFNLNSGYAASLKYKYTRRFLTSITEVSSECTRIPPYTFTYFGQAYIGDYASSALPPPGSKAKDFWGYYNGVQNTMLYPKLYVYPALGPAERYRIYPIPGYAGTQIILDGANRVPDIDYARAGSLQTVTFPYGGVTTIDYELNTYYDATGTQTLKGGGLRIKSASYFDGFNPASNIVKTYDYSQSVNVSSGRLITRPAFAIPISEYHDPESTSVTSYATLAGGTTQNLWEYLTVRTRNDISSGETTKGSAVGYTVVTVSRPGAGSTRYEYAVPGVYGESTNGNFTATTDKFARATACPAMGIIDQGGAWMFPYAPQSDNDWERGLVTKQQDFNQAGTKVREVTYTYQDLFRSLPPSAASPIYVGGVFYDHYPYNTNVFMFGKYKVVTDVTKVLASSVDKTYDENNVAKFMSVTTAYTYGNTTHHLLTTVQTTAADGTIYKEITTYPLDYGTITTPSGKPAEMIKNLQTNFRNGTPIEIRHTITKSPYIEKTVSASMTIFDDFGVTGQILPYKALSIPLNTPSSTFTASAVNGSGVFTYDSRYEVQQTINAYERLQTPLSTTGQSNVTSSTLWGYYRTAPVATIRNANYNEFVFSDFETPSRHRFQMSDSSVGVGRTGNKGIYPQTKLSAIIQKAALVNNYVFSFWFKKSSSSVDFTVKIKAALPTDPVLASYTITANPASADYEFYKKLIPCTALPSSFLVEITTSLTGTTPTLLPMIDDVAFYPEGAELTSYTYDFPFGVASVTDPSGMTRYNVYDANGRIKYVLDQNKSIIESDKYNITAAPNLSADFSIPDNLVDETPLTFSCSANPCIDGETYEWDFGSGYVSTGTTSSVVHTYPTGTVGTMSLTLRVSHPSLPQVTKTKQFKIGYKPITVNFCVQGVTAYNLCTNVMQLSTCSAFTDPVSVTTGHPQTGIYATHDRPGGETVQMLWYVQLDAPYGGVNPVIALPSGTNRCLTELGTGVDRKTYLVRCDMTSGNRTGSNSFQVTVNNCNN